MNELLIRAYNCYLVHLDNLNFGRTDKTYCLLYDAILTIANDIQEEQFIEYFVANLFCPENFPLELTKDMNRVIAWTLNDSDIVQNSFNWNIINAPINDTYPIQTNKLIGFNFFYLSIPQGTNFIVYNELNMVLYDSALPANHNNQLFSFKETMLMNNNQTNNIFRKNDIYNTSNSVLFKIKLY